MTQPTSNQVIYDGSCPICMSLKDFAESKVEDHQLSFIPYQSDDLRTIAPNLTQKEASQSLYVIAQNGDQIRGAKAVFEVMSQIPGLWGWLGKILRRPPFFWIAEPFYRLFAKHRHKWVNEKER